MSAGDTRLYSFWELALQDTLLDVAATIAATEPETAAMPMRPAAVRSALAVHWVERQEREPEMRTV